MLKSHKEQKTRQKLFKWASSKLFWELANSTFQQTKLYIFRRGSKFGSRDRDFARQADNHTVYVSSSLNHTGSLITAAYNDAEIVPNFSLFQELNEICFLFLCSLTNFEEAGDGLEEAVDRSDSPEAIEADSSVIYSENVNFLLFNFDVVVAGLTSSPDDVNEEEGHLCLFYEVPRLYVCKTVPRKSVSDPSQVVFQNFIAKSTRSCPNLLALFIPSMDSALEPPWLVQDTEHIQLLSPPFISFTYPSSEQVVLSEVYNVVGDKPTP